MLVFGWWVSLFCAIGTCLLTLIATMFYLHKQSLLLSTMSFSDFLLPLIKLSKCLSRCQIHLSFFLMYTVQVIHHFLFKGASVTLHNHQFRSALFKSSVDCFQFISQCQNMRGEYLCSAALPKKKKPDCSVLRNALPKSGFIFLVY